MNECHGNVTISDALFFRIRRFSCDKVGNKGKRMGIGHSREKAHIPSKIFGGGAFFMAVVEKNGNIVRKNRSTDEEVRPDAARKLTVRQTA